jgi:RNA polymerase sigma-70 factor (ECF subfamily)
MPATATVIDAQTIQALNPALLKFALHMVRRADDAEDLVQETWFSALHTVSSFEGRSSLKTWLKAIMRRRAVDHFRRQHPSEPFQDEDHASEASPGRDQSDWDKAARAATLALAALSPIEQRAIMLCHMQDGDRDEVADHMQITRGYLRVVLHRAHAKLDAALRRQGFGAELWSDSGI